MQPAISVRGVTKIFQEGTQQVPVLHGIDLDVHPGEFVLMMGPSGSGKTTLLSIMGCILRATSGSIQIAGKEVAKLTEKELPSTRLQNIGFIFQGFNLFPTLSVGENVELSLDLKGLRGAAMKTEARRLLAQVEMDHKYDSFPADLSGGQKQRVAVARALAGSPGLILADEPTAALDSHSGRNVMTILSGLAHDHRRAVVVVTHDHRVLEFADRIVRMEDGRIVPEGGVPRAHPIASPQEGTRIYPARNRNADSDSPAPLETFHNKDEFRALLRALAPEAQQHL